ncbi:MAG: hypothetical protein JRM82_03910 [Nitrososphaerota archaeon]|nr:hypothetical protein [Nitrososphaerota archaeon]
MSYHELWAVLSNWRREFSSGEFARTFYSPDSNKVLHDMTKKGMLEHTGTGRYRVRGMKEYVFSRNDVNRAYSLLNSSELPYALTGVDAVFAWTHGGYNVDRFFGFYPIHVKVKKEHVSKWRKTIADSGFKSFLNGEKPRETLFGIFFTLYPEERLKAAVVNGMKVDPLKETVDFCRKNIYSFEPALEMLDEEYRLGLGAKYREAATA